MQAQKLSNNHMNHCICKSFHLVTGTPSDLIVRRIGYSVFELSWTAPPSNTPPIAGYEVFLEVKGSQGIRSVTNTTETRTTVSEGLSRCNVYSLFVVAYSDASNTLASPRSETQMIEISEQNSYCNAVVILHIFST